jgi:serine/threonine-protein kinase RIO1
MGQLGCTCLPGNAGEQSVITAKTVKFDKEHIYLKSGTFKILSELSTGNHGVVLIAENEAGDYFAIKKYKMFTVYSEPNR